MLWILTKELEYQMTYTYDIRTIYISVNTCYIVEEVSKSDQNSSAADPLFVKYLIAGNINTN